MRRLDTAEGKKWAWKRSVKIIKTQRQGENKVKKENGSSKQYGMLPSMGCTVPCYIWSLESENGKEEWEK